MQNQKIHNLLEEELKAFEEKFTPDIDDQDYIDDYFDEIRSWLLSHDSKLLHAIEARVAGMKKEYLNGDYRDMKEKGYNQALDEVLAFIRDNKTS